MLKVNLQFFGGRGSNSPVSRGISAGKTGGRKEVYGMNGNTDSFKSEDLLDDRDKTIAHSNLLAWGDKDDYGSTQLLNKAKSAQKDLVKAREELEKVMGDFDDDMVGRTLKNEEAREKYYKDMATLFKRSQNVINKANDAFRKFGEVQSGNNIKWYADQDIEDRRHSASRIMDSASAMKRKLNQEAQRMHIALFDNGTSAKYPDYQPIKSLKKK